MEPCEEAKLLSIKLYGSLREDGHYVKEDVTVNDVAAFHIEARRCMKYQTVIENGWQSVKSVPSGGVSINCVMHADQYLTVAPYKEFRLRPGWTPNSFRATVHRAYQWGLTRLTRRENPPVE